DANIGSRRARTSTIAIPVIANTNVARTASIAREVRNPTDGTNAKSQATAIPATMAATVSSLGRTHRSATVSGGAISVAKVREAMSRPSVGPAARQEMRPVT